ncbi:MAG: DoxX family protein [Candidatus Limnocylindrales bacterium]
MVRLALAASFLSAVADRLGLWGPPGAAGVAWGSVPKYEEYVAQLNWFLPSGLVPVVGWAATACEVTLAIGLLIGWRLHWVAFVAGILLTAFAVTMAVALGPKSPLAYSVPSAAGRRSCWPH